MSYNQYPSDDVITIKVGEQTVNVDKSETTHSVPPKIEAWLLTVGWELSMQDPATYEQLFHKPNEPAAHFMYYRWYEAVAYEQFKFLTLSDGQNET